MEVLQVSMATFGTVPITTSAGPLKAAVHAPRSTQPAHRRVDRPHPVDVPRAHDGGDEPGVVAVEQIAPKAAPDLHLEQGRLGPLEVDVPAGAVERSLPAAHLLDLVEGIVPLAESLEGDLVRARQHLAHHVLEIQDRPALITVKQ